MLLGELDAATRPEFEDRLYELSESAHVSIDLSVATFVDLETARMLVACRDRAKRNGRFLQIINAGPEVERLLRIVERGYGDRASELVQRGEGASYLPPLTTSTDAERSRPGSEQIVRLECPTCGHQTFRAEYSPDSDCAKCGAELRIVAIFRDRREIRRPCT